VWHCRQLFLARDPLGVKPLYYADDGSTFRFATLVEALIKGGRIDASEDVAGMAGFYLRC
jgi:asparagine synthase (glutamine-hydrolysing)